MTPLLAPGPNITIPAGCCPLSESKRDIVYNAATITNEDYSPPIMPSEIFLVCLFHIRNKPSLWFSRLCGSYSKNKPSLWFIFETSRLCGSYSKQAVFVVHIRKTSRLCGSYSKQAVFVVLILLYTIRNKPSLRFTFETSRLCGLYSKQSVFAVHIRDTPSLRFIVETNCLEHVNRLKI